MSGDSVELSNRKQSAPKVDRRVGPSPSLANMNFKGTGTVAGSNNKRLGAAVQINRQDIPIGRDAFKGYSAWW